MDEPSELSAWTLEPSQSSAAPSRVTAVLLPQGFSNEQWMRRVAAEEKDALALFVQPAGEGFRVAAFMLGEPHRPAAADLEAATAILIHERLASQHEEVGFEVGDQLERVTPPSRPMEPGPAYPIRTDTGLEAYIEEHNRAALRRLETQLRSPLGVIPFVGAGMSKPYGFPEWGQFLAQIAEHTTLRQEIAYALQEGNYEEAAERLEDHLGSDEFQRRIADTFERVIDPALLHAGALSYLPFLTRGPVLTTNFDQVLEQAFRVAGRGFEEVVVGPSPDRTVAAIHRNRRALLKLHGDARDRTFRVFTEGEYRDGYEAAAPRRVTLSSLAWLTFTNRPLLFLGCSLEQDRTVEVLQEVHARVPGLGHYAVLATQFSLRRRAQREAQLRGMGISPLWFAPGRFPEIEELLSDLVDRTSTRLLSPPSRPAPPAPGGEGTEAGLRRFREAIGATARPEADGDLGPTIELIGRALGDGRLAFVLGAYANLGSLPLGNEFYRMLAHKFGAPQLAGDRAAVAAFVISRRGERALWQEVRAIVTGPQAVPGPVHRVLASLPGLLRARRRSRVAPLWVLTTNYDTLMEDALGAAGEPYYLLYHMGGIAAEHDGLFAVRSPDGAERVIEQPDHFRWLDDAHSVVVKLNGGVLPDSRIEESVAIATGHFERLAARIPDALPAVVRRVLRERSLLFLGHGLQEPDVKAVVRYGAPGDGTIRSWAVQRPPPEATAWRKQFDEEAAYLLRLGLEVVPADLEHFLGALHQDLVRRRF